MLVFHFGKLGLMEAKWKLTRDGTKNSKKNRSIANTIILLETGRELKSQTNGNAVKQKKPTNFWKVILFAKSTMRPKKTTVFGIETGFKYIKNKKGGMIQKRI